MSFKAVTTMTLIGICLAVSGIGAQKKITVPKDFPSIQKAIDEAAERDTVFVLDGIYKENIMMKDYIVIIGQDATKTVIRGDGKKPVVEGANACVLKNMTIENGGTGIICKNTNPTLEHLIIRNNKQTGIHCLISLPEIKNSLIYGNTWSGIFCELVSSAQRTSINHNLIADNGYSGITLSHRSEILIENNIFLSNKQFGLFVNEDSKRSRIVYNNFYNNRNAFNQYAVINETNTSKDPGLTCVDYATFSGIAGKALALKGMGKDHTDIGPLSEAAMSGVSKDSDNDGISDVNDQCPDMPEDKDNYQETDGCPDFDNDNDGIYDAQDKCPNDPEDFDGFEDQDGCPDIDNDHDGITDKFDKCPNTPEDVNGVMDDDGCPDGVNPAGPAKADTSQKGKPAKP